MRFKSLRCPKVKNKNKNKKQFIIYRLFVKTHKYQTSVSLCDLCPELVYDDVFAVWETIWAAKYASSGHFVLFIALALVEVYRDIILENNMDFTDIIKFFNGKRQLSANVLSTL